MPRPVSVSESMERAGTEQQSLEEDDDDDNDNDEFSYTCPLAHSPPLCMSLGDTQLGDADGPVPFSFKTRHPCTVKDDGEKNRIYAKRLARHTLELKEDAQEFEEPFYKDLEMSGSLSEEEDSNWTRTYHLPVHQRKHTSRAASVSPCDSYDSYQHGMGRHMGTDPFSPWAHPSDPHVSSPEHTRGAEPHRWHEESIGDREVPSLQVPYRVLWEENNMLRRMVRSMQGSLESQVHSMWSLECQLKASLAKEERRAQGLQALNQQTERSLHLMTQRALEAEKHVEKLKQEMLLLQGELESSKVENESLRVGKSMDPEAVKHDVDFALKNLQKIIAGANRSIKQLVAGTESLNFVVDILKSTGKISDAEAEEDQ
ncbi:serologically defined colon cancer antigen 3 homolog [Numida meleagris]|uniref:serologically defined colon cancer antigen 3 homolog n=1 Tax=Numida meleagris TaxID=8996 RepID=UPI000B3D986D|nr:serologically defined colon cancer antigen 3 homolog [Numida meleagris]